MALNMTFRKIKATDSIKSYVEKRTEKFEKFVSYPLEVHARLSVEKTYHVVEIECHAEHRQLVAIAKAKELFESIDLAAHKIEAQLKKEREKRKGQHSAHALGRPGRLRKLGNDIEAMVPHREKKLLD